ncbi:amidase [Paraburkholderia lacunae]|uniref:Asp-tRNA(Asn)/Glu-tRNA(Gln) amidotransferase GatCAB subunit A n=1 Tax=Paraburkholderia lacunae TaxID=2211104 RepID=A0A370N248_9BURK|nr:amidase [Paraburkholderia lacunae]RDJ99703.1 Asp-tRNA(Asn)/Glu-tRNA(Gln) amidotransferase GatCAB subunit A [Paraburkholderia lacunae]
MAIKRPTLAQISEIAAGFGFHLDEQELANYGEALQGNFDAYDAIDALPDHLPAVQYPRTPGYRPEGDENRFGAWQRKSVIRGAPDGKLKGKTVAIKDNVCVAGVPMMNGASTFEGYVPEIDATVVTRVLDAGATIVGKSVCEYFCFSGGSHTSTTGPVQNPRKPGHSTGGSSSGNGALVASGEVDMAIGSDQGGSVRIPSAYCGIVGMKPTHGLVPYTGAMPIEATVDHLGPMTNNVLDNALLLDVIAGGDGLDPRQLQLPASTDYSGGIRGGVAGLRIGILREGFGLANAEPLVDEAVRAAAQVLRKLGASVDEVSVPLHAAGLAIWLPIAAEGATQQMMKGNSHGFNWRGMYVTSMIDHHAGWRARADELPDTVKLTMVLGEYFTSRYNGRYYGKSQNLARRLRADYDAVLQSYDLLLMPTVPLRASKLPPAGCPMSESLSRAFEMLANTAPFDVSGHPAMSLPCGVAEDLPIGLQLVGRRFDEATIYRCAYAYEQAIDWQQTKLG